jgi:hypothetical protein
VAVAAWRLRPAYLATLDRPGRGRGRWWRRPAPGDQPVLWREQHVVGAGVGLLPGRLPRWLPLAVVAVGSGLLGWLAFGAAPGLLKAPQWTGLFFVVAINGVVAVVVAFRGAGAIVREQERGTWEPLVLTQLTAAELFDQKRQGIVWGCLPLTLAVTLPAFLAAAVAGAGVGVLVVQFLLPANLWFVNRWLVTIALDGSLANRTYWKTLLSTLYVGLLMAIAINVCGLIVGLMGWVFVALVTRRSVMAGAVSDLALPLFVVVGFATACGFLECMGLHFRRTAVKAMAYETLERYDDRRFSFGRRRR